MIIFTSFLYFCLSSTSFNNFFFFRKQSSWLIGNHLQPQQLPFRNSLTVTDLAEFYHFKNLNLGRSRHDFAVLFFFIRISLILSAPLDQLLLRVVERVMAPLTY